MSRGGSRPGAGAKKGVKLKATINKEMAREALRQIVLTEMQALAAAQIANAKGLKYLVARHKTTGKFDRLSEEDTRRILAGEESDHVVIEVWEKDPSVQAFTDLMNRALDKPKEQEQDVKHSGGYTIRHEIDGAVAPGSIVDIDAPTPNKRIH